MDSVCLEHNPSTTAKKLTKRWTLKQTYRSKVTSEKEEKKDAARKCHNDSHDLES
eukprot:m.29373 g.29373  ORF g.29373 m.29373 type:complete len:55 (+) comp16083_c0_seq1:196-360(+)